MCTVKIVEYCLLHKIIGICATNNFNTLSLVAKEFKKILLSSIETVIHPTQISDDKDSVDTTGTNPTGPVGNEQFAFYF